MGQVKFTRQKKHKDITTVRHFCSPLNQEQLIQRSPRGKRIAITLSTIENLAVEKKCDSSVVALVQSVDKCLVTAYQNQYLPSVRRALIWSKFHRMRCSLEAKKNWETLVREISESQQIATPPGPDFKATH